MPSKLFQGVLNQTREVNARLAGVVDDKSRIVACTDQSRTGDVLTVPYEQVTGTRRICVKDGYCFRGLETEGSAEFVIFVNGEDDLAREYAGLLAVAFENIKYYYDEKYDRENFVRNVLLENILPGDIPMKARDVGLPSDVPRTVFLIRNISSGEIAVYDIIRQLFPEKNRDFVLNITDRDIALVKETGDAKQEDLVTLGETIVDTLSGEFYAHVLVGIGTTVSTVKKLSVSFKEAQMALEVGKVFDTAKSVVDYNNLGIARLIYQLPTTLCEGFLREVFKRGSIESLDQETLFTIQKFFENNLNVSETARKLFIHRNTLVYRLEKIKKITGLDLREFDHAIVFKIALMVNKYLKSGPIKM